MPELPTDAAPWLIEIVYLDSDGQVDLDRRLTHVDAENAASYVSDYPELTEVIDPEASLWTIWLPNRLTRDVHDTGIELQIRLGDLQFMIDYDPH